MYTARVSKTDPHAFSSFGAVLRDARYANTDLYLHVEPGHYTEPHALEISTRVMVVPVAGPGTVEVAVDTADSVFAVTGGRAALELYGIRVRGAQGAPTVRADQGTRFKAADSVFTSGAELEVSGDGTEIVNCRFEDGGLYWKRGTGGLLRDVVFQRASLLFWRAVGPTVGPVRFTDSDEGALVVAESAVTVSDCVMTDFGRARGAAVMVKDGADARFDGLSISGSAGAAIGVQGEGTRAAVTDLTVTDWADKGCAVGVVSGAELTLTSGRITGPGDRALLVQGATVTAEGLTVENVRSNGVFVRQGRFTGRGLVFKGLGDAAVLGADSRFELSDVEIRDALTGPDMCGRGLNVERSRLEADGLRASGLAGAVVHARDSRITLASVTAERTKGVVWAFEGSKVSARGLEAAESLGYALWADSGTSMEVGDSLVCGGTHDAVHVHGAELALDSVTVSGAGGSGVVVKENGAVTMEDTVIRDGEITGVCVLGAGDRVRLVRSRITGNADRGVIAHPDALVETRDLTLRDNGGGDWGRLRYEEE